MDSSIQSPWITDGDVQPCLEKATAEESNELLRNRRIQHQRLDSKLSTHTNKVQEFEKWVELLQERAMTYRNLASVEAVASVLKGANEFHDQVRYQKEDSTSVGKKIESEDARDHDKALIDGPVSPSDNILDPDWNTVESEDDNECFFPFSPDARNEASNGKAVSTPPPQDLPLLL
jgi:hypothetical protein